METPMESSIIKEKLLEEEKEDIEIAVKRSKDNESNFIAEEKLRQDLNNRRRRPHEGCI
jgi:hypothetical protein